jgi:hypothetical protein
MGACGCAPRHFVGELAAVHAAGHDHIGEQQVEMDAALGDCDRLGCIGGLQGSVTKI